MRDAVRWHLVRVSPMESVDPPKPARRQMQVLNAQEARKLIQVAEGTPFLVPVALALAVRLRRGETFGLRWSDVNLAEGTIYVRQSLEQTAAGLNFRQPKTPGSASTLALGGVATRVLIRHKGEQSQARLLLGEAYQNNDLVCALENGEPWPPDSFSRAFVDFIRASGRRPVRFHDLRHSNITLQIERGAHIKVVSARARHSTIAITADLYGHILPGMDSDAASKIDEALGG